MKKYEVVIVGAGASGIAAAISAGRRGARVAVCDRLNAIGKKILASGGGRCNLLNEKLDASFYAAPAQELVASVLAEYDKTRILDFFRGLGLYTYSEDARIFPVSNQAASVLKVLEMELERLKITIERDFYVSDIAITDQGFIISSKTHQQIGCEKVILAAGGKSYPALGSDGSGYTLARKFGHAIIEPVPSAVALVVHDKLCHLLQGQKIRAVCQSLINGRQAASAAGELLFTQYGLSGTAILDISQEISVALNREHAREVAVCLDLVPFLEENMLAQELEKRLSAGAGLSELLTGILPNKFNAAFSELLKSKDSRSIADGLKKCCLKIHATRGWNEAEFTCGGIDTSQVDSRTLESKLKKGLYLCGEMLDIGGKRGGYNLAWAWSSGLVAGLCR